MRWPFIILVAATAACSDHRDFDKRYEDTAAELQERANAIDVNLSASGNDRQVPSANRSSSVP